MKAHLRIGVFFVVVLYTTTVASTIVGAQSSGPGAAVSLDGTNDFIQLPAGVWFNGPFTIEGWVYVRSYNNWSRLIDFGNGEYQQNIYLALSEGGIGYPKMGVFDVGNAPLVGANQQLPLNQWAHLAATYDGSVGTIYINGTNVGSGSLIVPPPNVTRLNNYIGRSNWGNDAYANALFDEVRIWNVARSQFQIQTFMGQSVNPQTNLVGCWRFNEGTGTSAADFTSNGRNGTLMGGVMWTNSTAPITNGFGTAVSFNGGQAVNVPHQSALNAYPLTVSAWFKTTNNALTPLVNKYVSASLNGWQMFVAGGQLTGWFIRSGANNIFISASAGTPAANDGQWHHAAFTVEATGGRLYQDGVLVATLPWSGTAGPVTTTQILSFGHYPGDSLAVGQIDEVSIWNTALPAEQIRLYASKGLVGTESNLVAYYRLDEGAGNTTIDDSGNGNNGTLQGGVTWVIGPSQPSFTARTLAATATTKTNVVLNGAVNPNGFNTAAWFEYGMTTNYGLNSGSVSLNDGSIIERPLSITVTNLTAGTLYHYRVAATNNDGMRFGDDMSFQTPGAVLAVTNLSDSGPGTLRQLIASASPDDVISIATNGTITLTSGELLLTKNITILGPGATNLAISGNHASRVFNITTGNANVSISGITIRDGQGSQGSPHGGGTFNAGTLLLTDCAITENRAGPGGHGPDGGGGGQGGFGGGVFNSGNISVVRCTLNQNRTGDGGAGGDGYIYGGFPPFPIPPGAGGPGGVGGAIFNSGTALISQCTIVSNSPGVGGIGGLPAIGGGRASNGGDGVAGGVYNVATLNIVASTLARNTSTGVANEPQGAVTLQNTIVALNLSPSAPDLAGNFISLGHNLIGQTNGATGFTNAIHGDLIGSTANPLDPGLADLSFYGGQTQTYQLSGGSPALDAGDDDLLTAPHNLDTDQRGFSRKVGAHVDIGAVELEIVLSAPSAVTLQSAPNQDPIFGTWVASLRGTVNPGGAQTATWFQFGQTTAYGGIASAGTLAALNTNNTLVTATISNLVDSRTYHYRVVASNSLAISYGVDRTFSTTPVQPVAGDLNGDGIVDRTELNIVQSNYFLTSPWLQMTNTAGLGGTNVTFALSGGTNRAFTVEYSTNLSNWQPLGPAIPRYEFTDTNAPVPPQRYYRLSWP